MKCVTYCETMKVSTLREAQHHLSRLVLEVEAGEEVVITRRGKRVIKLVPYDEPEPEMVVMPDFRAIQASLGTDKPTDLANEVIRLRDASDR